MMEHAQAHKAQKKVFKEMKPAKAVISYKMYREISPSVLLSFHRTEEVIPDNNRPKTKNMGPKYAIPVLGSQEKKVNPGVNDRKKTTNEKIIDIMPDTNLQIFMFVKLLFRLFCRKITKKKKKVQILCNLLSAYMLVNVDGV